MQSVTYTQKIKANGKTYKYEMFRPSGLPISLPCVEFAVAECQRLGIGPREYLKKLLQERFDAAKKAEAKAARAKPK